MSESVELFIRYTADGPGLAHRMAQRLGCLSYYFSGREYTLPVGGEAYLYLSVSEVDEGTAFTPYGYQAALYSRGLDRAELVRLGRGVFDRLAGLDLPLLYADAGAATVIADMLPGRGVREFPPGT